MSSNPPAPSAAPRLDSSSDSLKRVNDAAVGLYNIYAADEGDPCLDGLTEAHVEGDNLQVTLCGFGRWLAVTPIENRNTPGKNITKDTKEEYMKKIKEMLRLKFSNHVAWQSEKEWFSQLKASFRTLASRHELSSQDDYGDKKNIPIYNRNTDDVSNTSSLIDKNEVS